MEEKINSSLSSSYIANVTRWAKDVVAWIKRERDFSRRALLIALPLYALLVGVGVYLENFYLVVSVVFVGGIAARAANYMFEHKKEKEGKKNIPTFPLLSIEDEPVKSMGSEEKSQNYERESKLEQKTWMEVLNKMHRELEIYKENSNLSFDITEGEEAIFLSTLKELIDSYSNKNNGLSYYKGLSSIFREAFISALYENKKKIYVRDLCHAMDTLKAAGISLGDISFCRGQILSELYPTEKDEKKEKQIIRKN